MATIGGHSTVWLKAHTHNFPQLEIMGQQRNPNDQSFQPTIYGASVCSVSFTESEWERVPPECQSPPLLSLHKKGVVTP